MNVTSIISNGFISSTDVKNSGYCGFLLGCIFDCTFVTRLIVAFRKELGELKEN